MESCELTHWGVKGMRWGVRRFQNKDGSLTPLGKKKRRQEDTESSQKKETDEERRTRVLKSTNAQELYKNRDVLSTAEIKERLDRLDTEKRLASVAASTKKSGMDRVNEALKWARKVDEAYQFVDGSAIGKMVKKKLGIEEESKKFDLNKIYKNLDSLSDKQVKDAAERIGNADKIVSAWEKANEKNKKKNKK